jgi:type IV pilus assembly protein PilA
MSLAELAGTPSAVSFHVTMTGTRQSTQRGFTLVELMAVVAIVGVLSAIAIVGYKRYVDAAKVGEAVQVSQSIRSAEEAFRAETMTYLDVSTVYHPRNTGFNSGKMSWSTSSDDSAKWKTLGVTTDGPVRFGYKVNAGIAGTPIGTTVDMPGYKFPTTDQPAPWYVIQAKGNPGDRPAGQEVYMVGSSLTGELYWVND